jgi:hypothetical protein
MIRSKYNKNDDFVNIETSSEAPVFGSRQTNANTDKSAFDNSIDYKKALSLQEERRQAEARKNAERCLVGELTVNGLTSKTPASCAVEHCPVILDKFSDFPTNSALCAVPKNIKY